MRRRPEGILNRRRYQFAARCYFCELVYHDKERYRKHRCPALEMIAEVFKGRPKRKEKKATR